MKKQFEQEYLTPEAVVIVLQSRDLITMSPGTEEDPDQGEWAPIATQPIVTQPPVDDDEDQG